MIAVASASSTTSSPNRASLSAEIAQFPLNNIVTVEKAAVLRHVGYLRAAQEPALAAAIRAAFDLA